MGGSRGGDGEIAVLLADSNGGKFNTPWALYFAREMPARCVCRLNNRESETTRFRRGFHYVSTSSFFVTDF